MTVLPGVTVRELPAGSVGGGDAPPETRHGRSGTARGSSSADRRAACARRTSLLTRPCAIGVHEGCIGGV